MPAKTPALRREPEEPVLVPINGVAAQTAAGATELASATATLEPIFPAERDEEGSEEPSPKRKQSASIREPLLTVVKEEASSPSVAEDDVQRVWVKPDLTLLDTVTVRKERLHDEIKETSA
jgi:hypothetical protein